MIYVRLKGGLGNQLFQYAAGRAAAIRAGKKLFLIDSFLHQKAEATKRDYGLSPYSHSGELSQNYEILANGILRFLPVFPGVHICRERLGADPLSLQLAGHKSVLLDGYWQSEKYFSDYSDVIRSDLKVNSSLLTQDVQSLSLSAKMNGVNSISIHVRRGDYLANKKIFEKHGVLDVSYYLKAISVFKKIYESPVFFVFSDDIEWCKEQFVGEDFFFVDASSATPAWRDVYLMSQCSNNIIANSSYSWWGAWLNPNKDKIVVYPRCWYSKSYPSIDLIPFGWLGV